jgi:hypothetical protein
MRAKEFLAETAAAQQKKGRDLNHLEDFIFLGSDTSAPGKQAANEALAILNSYTEDASKLSYKWDGNPTVYWGREPDGTFVFVGKNNWGRPEGKSVSAEELHQFIMSRGKGEDWRQSFADNLAGMWSIFENATPADFRGYLYGDLLISPMKPAQLLDGRITFTPNQTVYSVDPRSRIGKHLSRAKVAVAAHAKYDSFGDKDGKPIRNVEAFNATSDLWVTGQTYVSHKGGVQIGGLQEIKSLITGSGGAAMDRFLQPVAGLGYIADTIYSFVNTKSKAKQLDDINANSYLEFLANQPTKAKKIAEHAAKFPGGLETVFALVVRIMNAKNQVISQLDKHEGDIMAHTSGEPGGEGYVDLAKRAKLVPRHRWTPYRTD